MRRILLVVVALAVTGCNDDFAPIEPSDRAYSIFGYLDASADTQWIRVMPVRHTLLSPDDPPDFRVTLEHVETGRVIEMRDTIIHFTRNRPGVGSEGIFLNHAWTTERIEPGATYRFRAQRLDGGPVAEAVVRIPRDFRVEVWRRTGDDQLRLQGVRNLAFVRAYTYFYDECGSGVQMDRFPTYASGTDEYDFPLNPTVDQREDCGENPPVVEDRELWIVGSGDPWPVSADLNPWAIDLPDVKSNITNSVGFLGGVLTKRVPFEECLVEGAPYCVMRYDPDVATLTGRVTDAKCGGPIARTTVRLIELDPDPARGRVTRVAYANRDGSFRVGALEPGRRYQLIVSRLRFQYDLPFIPTYDAHTDTLTFSPGERVVYDVALPRIEPC